MLFALTILACNIASTKSTTDSSSDIVTDSEDTGDLEPYIYTLPDLDVCDDVQETQYGFLCAIQPSRLDDEARDQYDDSSLVNRTLGFGYDVVAFPKPTQEINGVYAHFTGSMGRAYNQNNGQFPSTTILNEAMQSGFITIQIAYHNRYSVNSIEECFGSTQVDNCAGDVRREKITGENLTEVVEVPISDSIVHRMYTVIEYLEQNAFTFPISPVSNGTINWSNFFIGGHSQGAGHALYITKYWDSIHTCLFGGPFDVADTIPERPIENIADWYLDNQSLINIDKIRALLSVDDDNYDNFVHAYNLLNLEEGIHWQSFQATEYTNIDGDSISGHGAVVHDPDFAELRFETCFGNLN